MFACGFGCGSFAWVQCTGFTDGDGPGNLFLGQRTGDGDLMRSRFWVGCGCFFIWGEGGGKRSSRVRVPEKFSQDERFSLADLIS